VLDAPFSAGCAVFWVGVLAAGVGAGVWGLAAAGGAAALGAGGAVVVKRDVPWVGWPSSGSRR